MTTVFVTGATGFIGRHLVNRLLDDGHILRCLVRPDHHISDDDGHIQWIRGTLNQPDCYIESLRDAEYIVHLAGVINSRRQRDFHTTNVEGTARLLEACEAYAASLKRFVLVSSIAAVGPNSDDRPLTENHVPRPETEYGKTKLLAEKEALKYATHFPVAILRPTFVYGPGDMRGLKFLKLLSEQNHLIAFSVVETASLCYIDDLISACMLSLSQPISSGQIYHISDPRVYTWRQVHEILKEVITFLYHDPPDGNFIFKRTFDRKLSESGQIGSDRMIRKYWGCSIEKARRHLNFEPQFSLREGALETIKWYRDGNLYGHCQPPYQSYVGRRKCL
jgi:nucleoside-diphosphate-sugar epimerase